MENKLIPPQTPEKTFNGKQILLNQLPTLIINAVLPFLIYQVMTTVLHQPAFISLIVTGIPSTLMSVIGIIRSRRIDLLAGIVLAGIVVGLVLTLLSNDARLMLIRESFFSVAIGLAFLVSLLFPKPLTYYIGRSLATGNDPAQFASYEARWQRPTVLLRARVITAIVAFGLLAEAVVHCSLVFLLPVAQFLVISPFVHWGIIAATFATVWLYRRRTQEQTEKAS